MFLEYEHGYFRVPDTWRAFSKIKCSKRTTHRMDMRDDAFERYTLLSYHKIFI